MVKLMNLLKGKKELMILTFANLITQLGITYYVMNNTNVTDNDKTNMKHFDILELLNRNRRMQQINQQPIINQPIIIRGKQIYKRRTYEL